ncbi:MAG: nucleotide-binding protein [Minicystis sp.]
MTPAQRKNQDARKLLAHFYAAYEQVGGRNFFISPQDPETLTDVGMSEQDYRAAMNRLVDKGLLEFAGNGGTCSITTFGVEASEDEDTLDSLLPVGGASTGSSNQWSEDNHERGGMTTQKPDPKKVFIIHGRNMDARKEMGIFLRALGLTPLFFEEVRMRLGGSPTIGEVVLEGMKQAWGVIALFTPDEYTELRPDHRREGESGDAVQRWQSRPNVLFEAGMAIGRDPERKRVLLVKLGNVSLASDFDGIHFFRPTNDAKGDRYLLKETLKASGCDVVESPAWLHDGDFETPIKKLSEVSTRSPFRD